MKQMKKYLFRLVAFLGLTITPFIASAEEVSLGESISKFLNDRICPPCRGQLVVFGDDSCRLFIILSGYR